MKSSPNRASWWDRNLVTVLTLLTYAGLFLWFWLAGYIVSPATLDAHRAQCEAHELVYIPAADVCVAGYRPWGQP